MQASGALVNSKIGSERRWEVWAFSQVSPPTQLALGHLGTLVHNGYQMTAPTRSSPAASIQERCGGGGLAGCCSQFYRLFDSSRYLTTAHGSCTKTALTQRIPDHDVLLPKVQRLVYYESSGVGSWYVQDSVAQEREKKEGFRWD